jgi:Tol biopolymer transport system component
MLDQVFLMSADGGQVRQLTSPTTEDALEPLAQGEVRTNTDPDMSPDAHYVIFSSRATTGQSSLLRLDMFSDEVVNLTSMTSGDAPGADLRARYSPDGSRIAFTSVWQTAQVSLMSSDGRNFRTITDDTNDNSDPAWSPDGRWLVYVRRQALPVDATAPASGGEVDLVKVNIASGEQVVLARSTGQISLPTWAPDGNSILCIALPDTDHVDAFVQFDIFQVSSDGGTLRPLATTLSTSEAFVDRR